MPSPGHNGLNSVPMDACLTQWAFLVKCYAWHKRACHPGGHYWGHNPGTYFKWSQCNSFEDWNIVNSKLMNKIQWNPKRYSHIFIKENGVWQMAAILSLPQCVKWVAETWLHYSKQDGSPHNGYQATCLIQCIGGFQLSLLSDIHFLLLQFCKSNQV